MLEEALPNTDISWPLQDREWEEKYEEWIQNPQPYGGNTLPWIKDAKERKVLHLIFPGIFLMAAPALPTYLQRN